MIVSVFFFQEISELHLITVVSLLHLQGTGKKNLR